MNPPEEPVTTPMRSRALHSLGQQFDSGLIDAQTFQERTRLVIDSQIASDLDQAFMGLPNPEAELTVVETPGSMPSPQPQPHGEPAYATYEVIDPWDDPLGYSPLTLRKVRRMGWVLAIAMLICTQELLGFILPTTPFEFLPLLPVIAMAVISVVMGPDKPKTYRRLS